MSYEFIMMSFWPYCDLAQVKAEHILMDCGKRIVSHVRWQQHHALIVHLRTAPPGPHRVAPDQSVLYLQL